MYKYISIRPQYRGFLYKNNRFVRELEPGVYRIPRIIANLEVYHLPNTAWSGYITNQEVISKDNIALRLSLYYTFTISDAQKYIATTEQAQSQLASSPYVCTYNGDERVSKLLQERIRELIAGLESEVINTKRVEIISGLLTDKLQAVVTEFGIKLEKVSLIDVTFPKNIQDIFASELTSKIRARTDLENARIAVATARTYKNAAELMQGDENIRFIQLLETLQRIAAKGNHTFVIGEQLYGKK